jgi:signal transduction histidine kinase/streptogramin lyase
MLYLRKSAFLFFSFLLCSTSQTAQNSYRAVHWTLDDGLSQGEVYHMFKDVHNFLWVGTKNGLNRFDGNNFKKYYHDPLKSGTILGSGIKGIVEDSLHNLWIGTDKGISRYDIEADTFSNFLPLINNTFQSFIQPFWATSNEVYCIERETWITAYNTRSLKKRMVMELRPTDSIGMGPSLGYSFFDAKANAVWLLRGSPAMVGGGLLEISLSTGKRKEYGWPCYKKNKSHNHSSEAMRYDRKRNCLWINSPDGLMKFTLDDKQFYHIDAVDNLASLTNHEKNLDRWVGIDLDTKGKVWVAITTKGIVIYDPDTNVASLPFPENQETQKEVSDFNATVYCDREGIVWSGFWLRKGIYQLLPYSQAVKRFSQEINDVPTINFLTGPGDKLWIGTRSGGIRIFDPHTETFQVLRKEELPGLQTDLIIPISIDAKSNKAWLNSDKLYEMNLTTHQCMPIVFKDLSNQSVIPTDIFRPSPFGSGFLTTCFYGNNQGIFTMDNKSEVAREVLSFPSNTINPYFTIPVNNHLLFLKRPDAFGNLSYSFINGKWIKISTPLDSIDWAFITHNKADDSYWVVAGKQLIHYDKDFKQVRLYTPQDGLPEIDVFALVPDKKGNIWFNTDRSIHQLNIQTGTFSTLSEKDGFQKQNFILGPMPFRDSDGTLYFASGLFGTGFDQVNPDKYTATSSSVYIQSLRINDAPFPLSTGVNSLQELQLRYFENVIAIETGVIDYYSKGKNTLRYKLEGLDETWRYAPGNYTIWYDGLAPATYTLVLQAANASNEFNGPEKKLLIRISPPWWKTWWAYLFYGLCFIALVFYFNRFQRKRIAERERAKTRERELAQAKEIEKAYTELGAAHEHLKATQSQLIQSEKLASLGELTAGIAHEIQNPLNFVNNFAELSVDLAEELKLEIEKLLAPLGEIPEKDKEYVGELLTDLTSNQQKINHHGKRAASIVTGMLQHARTSSGKKEPTDLNALADEYLRLSYHGLRAKDSSFNAKMETDFDPAVGKVEVIPQDIGRVFLNIINNAFYATQQRRLGIGELGENYEPTVSISSKKENERAAFKIKDNGTGIPDDVKAKIFQPFFTTKPTGQGTGLGLSLAYDIVVKGHGGTLEVESAEGVGTEFIIKLPTKTIEK